MPTLEDVAQLLTAKGMTVAVAETCTAGRVGHLLTSVPGSSAYFVGGVLCYARSVKRDVLGVSADTLATYGSVHPVTALEMARRVRDLCSAGIGIATTGIAGPGGGTLERPVGLFYVAVSSVDGYQACREHRFTHGERNANREATAMAALELLKEYLERFAGAG